MKEYRKKIREKHLSNKTTKTEILNALSKEERTPNKEKEINERYKADIKNFVNGLKLDENFAIYQKKYHEDIQEIRKLVYADSEAQKNK
jgi:hypothetical protein